MNEPSIRKQVSRLISQNKTEEAFELLTNIHSEKIDKELAVLNGQYNRVKEDLQLHIISKNEGDAKINQINMTLLDLSRKLDVPKKAPELKPNAIAATAQALNPKLLWLLLVPVVAFLMIKGFSRNGSVASSEHACNYKIQEGKSYTVNSPVSYINLRSQALTKAEEDKIKKRGKDPFFECTINNGQKVKIINILPRYIEVAVQCENKTPMVGFMKKCVDGHATIKK